MSLPSIFNDNKVKINKIIKVIPFITNSLMFKILVSILSSIVLFDRLRVYDFLIDGIMFYFLFLKKIER